MAAHLDDPVRGTGDFLSWLCGVIYLLCWSMVFYPQIYRNYSRKSVKGLSFDYVLYNVIGFACYSTYCISRWITQQRYGLVHSVTLHDVIFTVHALVCTGLVSLQIKCYDRGGQQISSFAYMMSGAIIAGISFSLMLAEGGVLLWADAPDARQAPSHMQSLTLVESERLGTNGTVAVQVIQTSTRSAKLTVQDIFGYVKLFVNCFKFIPQIALNARRKSTEGLAPAVYILDVLGALAATLQNIVAAVVKEDWKYVTTNLPKMFISCTAMFYDSIILFQHFVLYAGFKKKDSTDELELDTCVELAAPCRKSAGVRGDEVLVSSAACAPSGSQLVSISKQ